ncbi:HesA/MoeB/ThiF family protein [Fusibacter ferrireducens]|uniref:HesA/MoeB/ThiF family protein n=1 Tax=Fusibacter ferrireducens TaxID=2785058 RepID=A0ABR9ZR43_9FIRM|nr:HesA/MoeB/ThiF family protein [Fusibacter ferrireducens]
MDRYQKNRTMFSQAECDLLKLKSVCVVGCGGLGGYVIEMLGRLGIGQLTVIDGDVFDETNLNRQLLSLEDNLDQSKAFEAKQRLAAVNSEVVVHAVESYLTEENALELLKHHDVIVDATDGIEARFILQKAAKTLETPLVYGAIAGWYAQVCTIMPGDNTLDRIYKAHEGRGNEQILGNPAFTPALAASVQVSEAVKLLLNRGNLIQNKMLIMDLRLNDFEMIHFE